MHYVLRNRRSFFSNERSFLTFFVPLQCLDHIPFELLLFGLSRYEMPEKIRALACLVFEISTVIHVFITHCVVSRDWVWGRDRMHLGAANRVTCSANEVLYPVKWDRMLVKGSRLCTIPRHERDLFRSVSQKLDLLELWAFFQVSCISIGQTKVAQRGCDPGTARGWKLWKMNIHSKKWTPISQNVVYSSNELLLWNIPEEILPIGWPGAEQ